VIIDPGYSTTVAGNDAVEKNVFSFSKFVSLSDIVKDRVDWFIAIDFLISSVTLPSLFI